MERYILIIFITLPILQGKGLNSIDKMLRRYHASQYELLVRIASHGPHIL